MDWKRESVDKLRCYEAKKSSIGHAEMEIQRLKSDLTRIRSATSDSTAVSGGCSTREDVMVNNIAYREELKLAIREAKQWVTMVEGALSVLDKEERNILDRFYIHRGKGNVERLCEELSVEKAQIYRKKDRALRHFTLALYGVTET